MSNLEFLTDEDSGSEEVNSQRKNSINEGSSHNTSGINCTNVSQCEIKI